MAEETEPTLAEQVTRWLNDQRHRAHLVKPRGKYRKLYEDAVLQHKIWMRRAHRFTLDDDFVRLATEAALVLPEKILGRIQYCTLPYETTWIEFDVQVKVQTSRSLGSAVRVPDAEFDKYPSKRMGYLLVRLNQTAALAIIMMQGHVERDFYPPTMTSVIFGTTPLGYAGLNTHGYVPTVISKLEDKPVEQTTRATFDFLSRAGVQGAASLWGYTEKDPADVKPGSLVHYAASILQQHAFPVLSPFYRPMLLHYGTVEDGSGPSPRAFNTAAADEMRENAGHMRWLVTVLAMMNEVPIQTRELKRDQGYRPNFRRKTPDLTHHVVTLALPRTKPLQQIARHLRETGQQRRAHDVRSHWRTYLTEKPCAREEHNWEYDQEHGYRLCGSCMSFGRLIHEYVRGNAELGWVRKEYKVVKGDQA